MKEIARWDCCGQGSAEQYVIDQLLDWDESMKEGSVGILTGYDLVELLEIKEHEYNSFEQVMNLSEGIWPTRDYFIYYNYHCCSGYKTKIVGNTSDEIQVHIMEPKGISLQAFWSEVIIFRLD